jgi:hypothetical protein
LFSTAARLYWRYIGKLLLLSGVLVVPFEIVVLVATKSVHGGHLTTHEERRVLLVGIADFVLIIPIVSAVLAHAVLMIGEGEQPRLGEVVRRSSRVLPTVVAASIITGIGVVTGLILFVLPGLWLLLRLYVVAQTAAIEGTDWPTTLRRSFALTRGSSWRIFGMLLIIGLINLTLENVAGGAASGNHDALQDLIAVVVTLLSQSFSALVGALLYFDLRAREQPV